MYSFQHRGLRPPPARPAERDGGHLLASAADSAQPCDSELGAAAARMAQKSGAGGGGGGVAACLRPGPTDPFLQQLEDLKEAGYQR